MKCEVSYLARQWGPINQDKGIRRSSVGMDESVAGKHKLVTDLQTR